MSEPNPSAAAVRCSVIVPTWQRAALLRQTLESLLRQSYIDFEVLVVSGSEDQATRALAAEFQRESQIRWLFQPENRDKATARNAGAHEANGDILLFLDDAVTAGHELIAHHMQHHLGTDGTHRIWVGGKIAQDPHRHTSSYVDRRLHETWIEGLDDTIETLTRAGANSVGDRIEKGLWCGLNCSIRRDLFLLYGGFNESLSTADEDKDLGGRLYRAGLELVVEPRAIVLHDNTKNLASDYRARWRTSGPLDAYRVLELGQKIPQTQHLVSMFHGYLLDRVIARSEWHLSASLHPLADRLETAANRIQSSLLFGAWARTCQSAEYWGSAKASGCTLEKLKQAVGPSSCALMLHTISSPESQVESRYYIAPRRFHQLMRWFRATGYKTATLAQWLQGSVPNKHVLLTFDDGYDDLFNELLPLVIEHRYKPVVFLVADRIGSSNLWDQQTGLRARNLLSLGQIREMQKYGVQFGSHTLTHPFLPSISDAELQREVCDSKSRLEDMLGVEITSFAYPFGGVDMRVRSAVATAGYKVAFTTKPGLNWWNDPLTQRRAGVNDYTSLLDFALKLRNGSGFVGSIAARLRSLEQELPTRSLRNLAGSLRRVGHNAFNRYSRERPGKART